MVLAMKWMDDFFFWYQVNALQENMIMLHYSYSHLFSACCEKMDSSWQGFNAPKRIYKFSSKCFFKCLTRINKLNKFWKKKSLMIDFFFFCGYYSTAFECWRYIPPFFYNFRIFDKVILKVILLLYPQLCGYKKAHINGNCNQSMRLGVGRHL